MLIMGKLSVGLGAPDWIVAHIGMSLEAATFLWTSIAVLIGIFFGGLMGFFNGSLITFLRLPPFIVTLGTLSIFNALKLWYSGSESVRASDIEDKAPFLIWFGDTFTLFGAQIALGGIALIVLAVAVWYLLDRTPWGRHVHAVGDDPEFRIARRHPGQSRAGVGLHVRRAGVRLLRLGGDWPRRLGLADRFR